MSDWVQSTASVLRGGKFDACETGHATHETVVVPAKFMGNIEVPIEVFNWERYANTTGYCPGDDDVSKSIALYGNYERPESAIVREILNNHVEGAPEIVVDIGCHVGWYTCIAALMGYEVLAVDADLEHLRVLKNNLRMMDVEHQVTMARGWFGPDTPVVDEPSPGIRFVKADIEGLENHVARVLGPQLRAGEIDYLLIEISPVMADHYPETVLQILDAGYHGYVVPGSAEQDLWGDPLEGHRRDIAERIAGWHQHNVIFERDGIVR